MLLTSFSPDLPYEVLSVEFFSSPAEVTFLSGGGAVFTDFQIAGLMAFPKSYDGSVNLPAFFKAGYVRDVFSFRGAVFYSRFLNSQSGVFSYRIFSLYKGTMKLSSFVKFGVYRRSVSGDYVAMNPSFERTSSFSFMLGGTLWAKFRDFLFWLDAYPLNQPDVGIVSHEKVPPELSLYLAYAFTHLERLKGARVSATFDYQYFPKFSLSFEGGFRSFAGKVGVIYSGIVEPFLSLSYVYRKIEFGFSFLVPAVASPVASPVMLKFFLVASPSF